MKKVIGMLAVVALVSSVASAELLKNFKYDGKVEVNAYQITNGNDLNSKLKDKNTDVETRVQLNTGFDLNDDVSAVVSVVKNNRHHGDVQENVNTIQAQLVFQQAYMNLKGVLGMDHKLGRQYYGNEGDLIVYYGPTGYTYYPGLTVSALDAWTGWYKTGKWDMHAVSGKVSPLNTCNVGTADTDVNLNGFVAAYDLMTDLKLGAYVYEQKNMQALYTTDITLDVVGVKATGKFMGFDYYGEVAKNYGHAINAATDKSYTGTAILANAKYGYDFLGKWTFMGEIARGSGDKKSTDKKNTAFHSINSDYRPGAYWGRLQTGIGNSDPTNVINHTGLTTWNVGAKWNPSKVEKLDLSGKYYYFAPTETKLDGTKIGYTTVGTELDLAANWKHSESVNVRATLAAFMPNKKWATTGGYVKHDTVNYAGLDFIVKF